MLRVKQWCTLLYWIDQPLTTPANGRPNTDLWPDTSAYDPAELYPVLGLAPGSVFRPFASDYSRVIPVLLLDHSPNPMFFKEQSSTTISDGSFRIWRRMGWRWDEP
ncbi:hypothetical protein B0H14DRAFT_3425779 [Mycena olivaceomarginata]|nr:hypothetical protein B0H14DRAFT_3425779 [Mycena olivaceomarginata]